MILKINTQPLLKLNLDAARKDHRQASGKSAPESLPIDSETFLNLDEMLLKQRTSNKPKQVRRIL